MNETTRNSVGKVVFEDKSGAIKILNDELNVLFNFTVSSESMQEVIDQAIEKEKVHYLQANHITDKQWSDSGVCVYSQFLCMEIKDGQFNYSLSISFMDMVDASLHSRINMDINLTEEQKEDLKMPILQSIASFFGI